MIWWQIVLIVCFVINLIIAIIVTIVFKGLGYFDYGYRTNWGKMILVFIILMIVGLPVVIFGLIKY